MSSGIKFELLSLGDVIDLKEINVYKYDNDIVLTTLENGVERIIHLYENELNGRSIYGINKGQVIKLDAPLIFTGRPASIEVSYCQGKMDWDFRTLLLKGGDDAFLRIYRNDASFPEPTFVIAS